MKRVFLDTDIFVRDFRGPNDRLQPINEQFLKAVRKKEIKAATSLFNVLETCGVLAFHFSKDELLGLYANFTAHYAVTLFVPADSKGQFMYDVPQIFSAIQTQQHLGDAQITSVVNRFSDNISAFVSWNARHFQNRLPVPVMTPEEYLARV